MIINKVNNDITDIDLIGYTSSSDVSTNVSTNARGGDILLLAFPGTPPRTSFSVTCEKNISGILDAVP
jgi:hypothetical protein